jgi:hypothetical protein
MITPRMRIFPFFSTYFAEDPGNQKAKNANSLDTIKHHSRLPRLLARFGCSCLVCPLLVPMVSAITTLESAPGDVLCPSGFYVFFYGKSAVSVSARVM